jgi:phosphatidylinositol alpha-1,6-mannosyltransferase
MKVLIYTHEFPPFLGGLATTSLKLARGLASSGLEVSVLAPGYGKSGHEADGSLGVAVTRIPSLGAGITASIPYADILLGRIHLSRAVDAVRPDAVLFITEEAEAAGGLLSSYPFTPIVRVAGSGITTCFLGSNPLKRLMRHPMARLYKNSPLIIAVSESTKGLLREVGIPSEKIKVIYNGVEDEMLSKAPDAAKVEALRKKYEISPEAKVLITVARVLPRKGQDTVIKALPAVLSEFPDTFYLIVGDGRYVESFRELAERTEVSGRVIFTGGVGHSDVAGYFDLSEIFVMPNRYWNNKIEGLPNVLLEASARGKPVIAGNHGGSVEAVEHGVTGFLVNPESVEEVSDAILRLLRDPALARGMGDRGKLSVSERHTVNGMIEHYASAIRAAVESPGIKSGGGAA